MSSSTIVTLEIAITAIVIIGWGLWELYSLKKGR
jgi:hypothetical protein